MDKVIYLSNLFDYYGKLLSEKKQNYFKDYYFKNLSLSEISENEKVSRNAIYKQIKEAEKQLIHYEKVLKQYQNSLKIRKIIKNLDPKIKNEIEKYI